MSRISNDAVVEFFENETDSDLKENFVGVFPSNYIIKFISFHQMAIEKTKKYPFIIMNTDRSDKSGTHWWSCLDLHEKKEIFLFDNFGFTGFKKFVIDNDVNILNKILYSLQKFQKKDQKITIITIKFSMKEYENIKNEHRLRQTTQDLLHLIYEYGRLHNIKDSITIHSVTINFKNSKLIRVEYFSSISTLICFYFKNSSIIEDNKLSKRTIEKLLNEIFSLDRNRNEEEMERFAKEKNIRRLK